jgi:hypothetical protein
MYLNAIKLMGGVEVQLHAFLTSALDTGVWSASRTSRLTAEVRNFGANAIGLRGGPDALVKKK